MRYQQRVQGRARSIRGGAARRTCPTSLTPSHRTCRARRAAGFGSWPAGKIEADLLQLEIRSFCFDITIRAEEAAWHYNTISLWKLVRSQAGSQFFAGPRHDGGMLATSSTRL